MYAGKRVGVGAASGDCTYGGGLLVQPGSEVSGGVQYGEDPRVGVLSRWWR